MEVFGVIFCFVGLFQQISHDSWPLLWYNKEVKKLADYESNNESKYSQKKFKKIENRVFNSLIHKKEDFQITLKLEVYYQSNGGRVNENRKGKYNFEQLIEFYNEWQNGNKYEETKKQERKIWRHY